MIRAGGVEQLAVGDLRADEIAGLAWSGNPAHLRRVAAALQRAARGMEDYLVVRAPAQTASQQPARRRGVTSKVANRDTQIALFGAP